jgi:hypothetical protein
MGSLASDAPPKGCQFAVYEVHSSILTGLVVDTTDVETLVALPEGYSAVSNGSTGASKASRQRTIALDGDGCDISALLDGSGRGASNGCGECAGNGSNGNALHCNGVYVSDGISSMVEVVAREELFVGKLKS